MDLGDLDPDPLAQLAAWRAEAGTDEACLATASADGAPAARMVLVRRIGPRGCELFTNRTSAKGRDLAANPRAALVFYWAPDRQVRVTGPVEVVDDEGSDAYWDTRPRGSQLGAWASEQSRPIADRGVLDRRLAEVTERFAGGAVPRPPHWGGYRVVAETVEFWHHRDDRLHDRIRSRRPAPGEPWARERLSP
ncbi:MAG TPA: pyridoxamine 5'-phosphate oxidase [Acidimicrobiales bacterium]|nr:pyridoxamine 5'-phosphate oxidase [Acidimicrobiales bacterium]